MREHATLPRPRIPLHAPRQRERGYQQHHDSDDAQAPREPRSLLISGRGVNEEIVGEHG